MKLSLQQQKMKKISSLLSRDLGYIHGDRESGPNGDKKHFLDTSAAFLRQLSKDLGFSESTVSKNAGGVAVSGEVSLRGVWNNSTGVHIELSQNVTGKFMYREISHLKDFAGKTNQWLNTQVFDEADYDLLLETLSRYKKVGAKNAA